MSQTIELARRGQLTIPEGLREQYGIQDGQRYAIRVLEGGIVVLTPHAGKVSAAVANLRESLTEKGATREALLAELRRVREGDGN